MRTPSPRLFRAVSRLLVPALLLAGTAAPAAAQPACPTGALALYLAPGFACQNAGWVFTNFLFESDAFQDGSGASVAPALDGSDVVVTPFEELTAGGTLYFGFDLDGFRAEASVPGGDVGEGFGHADATLLFESASLNGTSVVTHAGLDLLVEGFTDTPGRTELFQETLAVITHPADPFACLFRVVENHGPGSKPRSIRRQCDQPLTALGTAILVHTDAERFDGRRTASGLSTAEITRVVYAVAPEPGTVALLGGGLLGLAAIARRRRA